jgi:hypothetical protein
VRLALASAVGDVLLAVAYEECSICCSIVPPAEVLGRAAAPGADACVFRTCAGVQVLPQRGVRPGAGCYCQLACAVCASQEQPGCSHAAPTGSQGEPADACYRLCCVSKLHQWFTVLRVGAGKW